MKLHAAAAAAILLLAAAGSHAQEGPRHRGPGPGGMPGRGYANPTALIAAEVAFAQLAQEKGQWTAFRTTAAPDGEIFVPQRVNAREWLKKRANPPIAVKWQPHDVWMSCDGSAGITRGAWQRQTGTGWFSTVWKRQPVKRGKVPEYLWVLDQGDDLAQPLPAPEMIAGKVADCRRAPGPVPASPPPAGVDARNGASDDLSLQWSSWVWPDGRRLFSAWLWNGTSFDPVLNLSTATPPEG